MKMVTPWATLYLGVWETPKKSHTDKSPHAVWDGLVCHEISAYWEGFSDNDKIRFRFYKNPPCGDYVVFAVDTAVPAFLVDPNGNNACWLFDGVQMVTTHEMNYYLQKALDAGKRYIQLEVK
jgi:hypothetical protein